MQFAQDQGMTLHYIERTKYRLKNSLIVMTALQKKFGRFFTIPEGGSNQEAIVGCAEMINEVEDSYDYYFVSVGTGGTLAGIIEGLGGKGKIIGFSSLKGEFLTVEVSSLLSANGFKTYDNWEINGKYHFGGYAKFPNELKDFMCTFEETHGFQLDPIYTAKAMYGALDMIKQDMISSGSKVLFTHRWLTRKKRIRLRLAQNIFENFPQFGKRTNTDIPFFQIESFSIVPRNVNLFEAQFLGLRNSIFNAINGSNLPT